MLTPVAVFSYNRPHHLRQLLSSLLNCSRLDECQVYVYCDGVKKTEHEGLVGESRQTAREFAPLLNNAVIVERDQNLGLTRSIVSGVTELCGQYGRVIVLEDDLILHPFFLDFMLQSLDRYADDDRVAQVAGYLPPIHPKVETDSFFSPLTTSCGWATWQRAWNLFTWDASNALEMLESDPSLRTRFNLDDCYPYSDMLRTAVTGHVDSWAILWYWHTFYRGKLTLYPHRSLVWVGGFDNLATHTKSEEIPMFYDQSLDFILRGDWNNPVSFPEITQADELAFGKLKDFLQYKPSHTLPARLKKLLKRVLSRLVK